MNLYFRNLKPLIPIAFILALLPAIILGLLILNNAVNVPYWDQWEFVNVLQAFYQGQLSFQTFFYQQNESRLAFPRVFFLSLAQLTHWDVRYEMLTSFLLVCLVSYSIYRLSRLTLNVNRLVSLLVLFISNLLIFAPIQYENWLWGIQLIVFVPITCITLCILTAYSTLSSKAKFLICASLCTISTFSYANGIIAWVLIYPILSISISWKWKDIFKNKLFFFGWIGCFSINAIVYFYDYKKPSHHPSFIYSLQHPFQALEYLFSFLGSPFRFSTTQGDVILAASLGAVLIILFIFSTIYLVFFTGSKSAYKTIGWQTIGGYSLMSALITTLGRVGFGVQQSLSSRYTTFSLYLAVAVVHLVAITLVEWKKKKNFRNQILWISFNRVIYALLAIFFILYLIVSVLSAQTMPHIRHQRLKAKACIQMINVVSDDECLKTSYPIAEEVKKRANFLNEMKFLNPKLTKSNRVEDIADRVQPNSNGDNGWFDGLNKVDADNELYAASGWAILPDKEEPADAVILAYENNQTHSIMFKMAYVEVKRKDVAKVLKNNSYRYSGWQTTFAKTDIPAKNSLKINAWALDASTGRTYKLQGSHSIP
jgi:hypothetical protein